MVHVYIEVVKKDNLSIRKLTEAKNYSGQNMQKGTIRLP